MSPKSTTHSKYLRTSTLAGRGVIGCLAATPDGRLASGGSDGVDIWNLNDESKAKVPTGAGHRGDTTAVVWIRRDDSVEDGLVYGTQAGLLIVWKETREKGTTETAFEEISCAQMAYPSEVTGLAFEPAADYLAACNRDGMVQLYSVDTLLALRNIFSLHVDRDIPKAIAFRGDRNVLMFGLHSGKTYLIRATDGGMQELVSTRGMIGDANVDGKRDIFCIDDPAQGAALYRMQPPARVRTYSVPVTKTKRACDVSFAEESTLIIIGSDHGVIYVFEKRTGEIVDMLKVGSGWVQTLTVVDIAGVPSILAVQTDKNSNSDIMIWKRCGNQHRAPSVSRITRTKQACITLMCLTSLAFLFQNMAYITGMVRWMTNLVEATTPILDIVDNAATNTAFATSSTVSVTTSTVSTATSSTASMAASTASMAASTVSVAASTASVATSSTASVDISSTALIAASSTTSLTTSSTTILSYTSQLTA